MKSFNKNNRKCVIHIYGIIHAQHGTTQACSVDVYVAVHTWYTNLSQSHIQLFFFIEYFYFPMTVVLCSLTFFLYKSAQIHTSLNYLLFYEFRLKVSKFFFPSNFSSCFEILYFATCRVEKIHNFYDHYNPIFYNNQLFSFDTCCFEKVFA